LGAWGPPLGVCYVDGIVCMKMTFKGGHFDIVCACYVPVE